MKILQIAFSRALHCRFSYTSIYSLLAESNNHKIEALVRDAMILSSSDIDPLQCTFEQYDSLFKVHGGTDSHYLEKHFHRFQNTLRRVTSNWEGDAERVVVDVGAHWLHQSLLYALMGCKVDAFNVPTTFKKERVRNLASHYGINLTAIDQLETGECFYGLEENSVDVVLFTEILEHITFNPIRFWKLVYRMMKPGGRIIVTTPNYYSLSGRAFSPIRFFSGHGAGLTIDRLFRERTFGHHWKEYSMQEVKRYFGLLSPDFTCAVCEYVDDSDPETEATGFLAKSLPRFFPFLKPGLHVEVELTQKRAGIEIMPGAD